MSATRALTRSPTAAEHLRGGGFTGRFVTIILAIALLGGCQQQESTSAEDQPIGTCGQDLPVLSWESFGQGFFEAYCQGCHSSNVSDRRGAPPGITFDSEDAALASSAAITSSTLSEAPTMPPGGGVPDDERALLTAYLRCAGR